MTSRFRLAVVAVILLFVLPLMRGLREPDLDGDEAIYSYAVQRVLDTGDWLTPRSIPSDEPFLEKPPLKIWIVAGGIASGLLPRDERGFRFFDALFGAIAFLYVFAIARALGGTAAAVVSVLVLFTMTPLVFNHGLRSNDMDASVFLCYCGGIFHFWRWMESNTRGRRQGHALAVAGFFALGFMTKFVAALFLPLVCVIALIWRHDALSHVRERWRDWLLPIALLIVATSPWFIYETRQFGQMFWHIIFGVHVFTRFTGALDPGHLHSWHYYFSETWKELGHSGTQVLVLAGLVLLGRAAWRGEAGPARLVLIWGVVPLVLISIGTSKLLHYAYPFWPPLAIGAGLAFASALRAISGPAGAWLAPRLARIRPGVIRRARPYLLGFGVAFAALAAWTAFVGPVVWTWNDVTILRSTSVSRPLAWSVTLVFLSVYGTTPVRLAGGLVLMLLLPLQTYVGEISGIGAVNHPLRASAECAAAVQAESASAGRGVFSASGNILHHSYYYYLHYLWHLGPRTIAPEFREADTIGRLTTPGGQTLVILNKPDYDTLYRRVSGTAANSELLQTITHDTVRYSEDLAVILPGPYARCAAPILAAGGRPIWPHR